KLQKFIVRVFASDKQLAHAFGHSELTAAEGLTALPPDLKGKDSVVQHSMPMRAATMVFFKTSSGVLADQMVRHSLVQATDTAAITKQLNYLTHTVKEPLLDNQLGYDPKLTQPTFDINAAKANLSANGWTL